MHVLIVSFDYDDTIMLRVMLADTFNKHVQPLLDAEPRDDELLAQSISQHTLSCNSAQSWDETVDASSLSQFNIAKIIHIPVMDC